MTDDGAPPTDPEDGAPDDDTGPPPTYPEDGAPDDDTGPPPTDPEDGAPDDDLQPLVSGRSVDLGRAVVAALALMFLTGAAVYAWQQAAHQPDPSPVDIGFADDMRTHHLQGVAMALTYLQEGTDPILRQLSYEIVLVQAGETRLLDQWLEDWGSPDLDLDTAMGWMGMQPVPRDEQPGMASEDELDELDVAQGETLDDLYSRLMIDHHRGGLHMAEYAADHAAEKPVRRLAESMVTTQRSEVAELNLRREAIGLSPA